MAEENAATEGKEVSREEAQRLVEGGAQLLDVRTEHEWEAGRIPGATHLPLPELAERAGEVDRERPVVIYCRGGNRSTMAAAALGDAGYDAAKLSEGIVGWEEAGLPLDPDGKGYVADSGEAAAVLQARKRTP
ncbi:MAG TPA: rhodanese-like domain-containing protein [Solirubrobacterales bacterium]|nr:rhodanese-like domain-containing protein [Solirubrobacterales bacterium]